MNLCRVSGFCLLDWLVESPSYSETSLAGYTVQLLSALSYIHTSNIVHRDIRYKVYYVLHMSSMSFHSFIKSVTLYLFTIISNVIYN